MSSIASNCIANLVVTLSGATSPGSTKLNCNLATGSSLGSTFTLANNTLTVKAPKYTPIQVNFTLKNSTVPNTSIKLSLNNVTFNAASGKSECPIVNLNSSGTAQTATVSLAGLKGAATSYNVSYPPNALSVIDANSLSPNGTSNNIHYTIHFQSATATKTGYSWDPDILNENNHPVVNG